MFNRFGDGSRKPKEEAEKPFWISYADLMTALMFLFLVIMVAAITTVTYQVRQATVGEKQRGEDIASFCESVKEKAADVNDHIVVDCHNNNINFGTVGTFDQNDYKLKKEGQKALLDAVPVILDVAESPEGKRWFKQIVIEGFTDTDGDYLYNLDLSLKRSEWVMCSLLDPNMSGSTQLSAEQRRQIKEFFLAGGVSFNNAKESKAESRRVELRLHFYGMKDGDERPSHDKFNKETFEQCSLR